MTTTDPKPAQAPPSSALVTSMAAQYEMSVPEFRASLSNLILGSDKSGREPSQGEVMACLAVAKEHGLNPFTKEIHFFRDRTGQIRPVVGVDGWVKLANKNPMMNGFNQAYGEDDAGPWCETVVYRRDWANPVVVREYLKEAKRNTEPWNNQPRRMLGHRSYIQAVRKAFGFAGIMDEDDFGRMVEWQTKNTLDVQASTIAPKPRTLAEATKHLQARAVEPEPVDADEPWSSSDSSATPDEAADLDSDPDPRKPNER